MKNTLLALVVLVFLTGCQTTRTVERLPLTLSPQEIQSKGLLVGSISINKGDFVYASYTHAFRKMNGAEEDPYYRLSVDTERAFFARRMHMVPDFEGPEAQTVGQLFAVPLEAGQYEFYNQYLYENNGLSEKTFSAPEEYSQPFTIKPGEVTYVGELKTIGFTGKNIFGLPVSAGGALEIHDRRKRDLPLLKAKYPDLNWAAVHYEILK